MPNIDMALVTWTCTTRPPAFEFEDGTVPRRALNFKGIAPFHLEPALWRPAMTPGSNA